MSRIKQQRSVPVGPVESTVVNVSATSDTPLTVHGCEGEEGLSKKKIPPKKERKNENPVKKKHRALLNVPDVVDRQMHTTIFHPHPFYNEFLRSILQLICTFGSFRPDFFSSLLLVACPSETCCYPP